MKLVTRSRTIEFPRRPLIMGIVNLCADSFSGDGITDIDAAVEHAKKLVSDGAEIIDIGAESAGTKRAAMSEQEEIARLCEFIRRWNHYAILSINTWRPAVARAALALGGDILNDIGGLPNDENARLCAETGAALLIMHNVGEPKIPHTHVRYDDVMETLDRFFTEKIALAEKAGVSRDSIILDPGIDFAKQREDNLRIHRELDRLQKSDRPILLPVSRKTVIGQVLDLPSPADRDPGTMACIVAGALRGAHIFRVHNVRAAAQTIRALEAVLSREGKAPAEPAGSAGRPEDLCGSAGASPSLPSRRVRKHPVPGVRISFGTPTIVFLTVCTKERAPWLAADAPHRALLRAWREADVWQVGRYVLMPDHLHLFCAPVDLEMPLENWVRFWKSRFRKLTAGTGWHWQTDQWDRRLRRTESYDAKWEYVRRNPVRAGLATHEDEWPWQGVMHELRW